MSLWCILGLMCGPALQRVASLSDYSPTRDPPPRLPVPLGMANRAELWPSSSRGPASQCPLDSTHRRPNKQTRGSNFMPSSLSGVPATRFSLFIYSRFRKAPLGMFEVEVLGSQTVCGRDSDSCLTSPMQKISVYARIWHPKHRQEEKKEMNWTDGICLNVETSEYQRAQFTDWKGHPYIGRRYVQIIGLIRN